MKKSKEYKNFFSNYNVVFYLFIFCGLFLIVSITFATLSIPWFVPMVLGIICLGFACAGIIAAIKLKCKMDNNGITMFVLTKRKIYLAWNDIISLQIECYLTNYGPMYVLEMTGNDITFKIKTYRHLMPEIEKFSRCSDYFQNMFITELKKAESSY